MTRSRGNAESDFVDVDGAGERAAEKLIDQFRSIWRVSPFGPNVKSEEITGSGRRAGAGEVRLATTTWADAGAARDAETCTTVPVEGGWSWSLAWINLLPGVEGTGAIGGCAATTLGIKPEAGRGAMAVARETRLVTGRFPARDVLAETRETLEVVAPGTPRDAVPAAKAAASRPMTRQTANRRAGTPPA